MVPVPTICTIFFDIFNPPRIHLAEAILAALGDESTAISRVALVVLLLVLVSHRGTVNDHIGPVDRLLGLIVGLHPHFLELLPALLIDTEFGPFLAKDVDFCPVGQQRGPLVEGDLVDAERLAESGKNADQRLPNGPGPYYMYNLL